MAINILVGSLMMIVTTLIHGGFMTLAIRILRAPARWPRRSPAVQHLAKVAYVVLAMFAASLVEVAAWAAALILLGAISGVEPALYFSTVTFTTLGYGDVLLDERWRLLGSFEAANGIIMMGWTTAVVVAAVQHVAVQTSPTPVDRQEVRHV